MRAWVHYVNANGGMAVGEAHLPVELLHYDDGSDPDLCGEYYRRLNLQDAIDVFIGPYSSGLARRAAGVATESGRVLWNHGGALGPPMRAQDEAGRGARRRVVNILSPADTYFHGVIDYALRQRPALKKVAVVHSTAGEFPRQVASGAVEHCERLQLPTPTLLPYPADVKDFEPVIQRLRQDTPELLLGVGRIEDDIEFARQLNQARLEIDFVGLIASPLASFQEELGETAEGVLGPSQWEPGVGHKPDYGPMAAEVIGHLADVDLRIVDYPAAQAYAGCMVAQRCIEDAGSLDAEALWDKAGHLDFTTFYGRFRIDARTGRQEGHVMPVIQWRNGRKEVVWTPDAGAV